TCCTHHEDAAAIAVGTKSDPLAIGRKSRVCIIAGLAFSQVLGIASADALPVDVPLIFFAACVNDALTVGREAWKNFFTRLVSDLNVERPAPRRWYLFDG